MAVTISIPPGVAYGADEAVPDTQGGMSVEDAIYHTVHNSPGGVTALAARMGVSPNTLTHKANPNNATHHLHPRELVTLQHMSGNAAVLHAMASQLGYTCTAALPDQTGGDVVEAFMHMQRALANLVCAVADPLAQHGDAVTRNEMRRAEAMAGDMHTAIGHVLASMRGSMRKAPEVAP